MKAVAKGAKFAFGEVRKEIFPKNVHLLNHVDFYICVSHMSKLPTPQISALQLIRGFVN
jgi:hypothetical protein